MPAYALWHNPLCSKSCTALDMLRERGVEPAIRHYLAQPPDAAEVRELLAKLGLPARALLRSGEAEHGTLGLDDPALGEDALVVAMVAHPQLIERPILVAGTRAILGRPPERVLDLL